MRRNTPHYKHQHGGLPQTEVQEYSELILASHPMNLEQHAIVLNPRWSSRRTCREGPKGEGVKLFECRKKSLK